MAAASTTPGPPPPPPRSESTSTSSPKQQSPPPPPPSGADSDTPLKRRKLEEVGFHHSPYYKIRVTVSNLRGRFLQVCQGTDSQKKDAAHEILKEIKFIMELSKKTRLDLYSVAEPVKQSVKPADGASKDKPAEKISSEEKNQGPSVSQAGNFVHSTAGDVPLKPDNSEAAGQRVVLPVEDKKEGSKSEIADYTKQQCKVLPGSYVIGGSPINLNFLMWRGSKPVYYGLTKAEWLARQSAC